MLREEPAFAVHLALWYVVLVCHQYDVCKNYVSSVYVGERPSVLLLSVVMLYVNCGNYG